MTVVVFVAARMVEIFEKIEGVRIYVIVQVYLPLPDWMDWTNRYYECEWAYELV
jgi:hypothetical protein